MSGQIALDLGCLLLSNAAVAWLAWTYRGLIRSARAYGYRVPADLHALNWGALGFNLLMLLVNLGLLLVHSGGPTARLWGSP